MIKARIQQHIARRIIHWKWGQEWWVKRSRIYYVELRDGTVYERRYSRFYGLARREARAEYPDLYIFIRCHSEHD